MKTIQRLSFIFFLLSFTCAVHAAQASPLLGLWKTLDDVSGKPKAVIRIEEGPGHTFIGRIVKTYPTPGEEAHALCIHCKGDKKNQPLLGMVILEHLVPGKENKNTWINGQILDPSNGKTYHCRTELIDAGKKLNVRGYIGLALFGRSQTWVREEKI